MMNHCRATWTESVDVILDKEKVMRHGMKVLLRNIWRIQCECTKMCVPSYKIRINVHGVDTEKVSLKVTV